MILGEQPFHIRRQPAGPKKKKKSQVAPAGVLCCSAHLLRSSLPNSHSPLNFDGVECQNRDTENAHASESSVVRVGKARHVCGVKDKLDT